MTIRVSTPSGAIIEFPEGTSADVIRSVVTRAAGGQSANSNSVVQEQPPVSAGEMASDVAKSAGIGLVQGGIGLATLPGNIEALGRAGINAGASLVGVNPIVDGDTFLTNYNDAKRRVEGYTGKFYEPKTTAGKYARTMGEFAPAAIGGGGLAARAARVALPAVGSETAGQITEGTAAEPFARLAGAIAGGRVPNVAARMATPAPADAGRAAAVQTLQNNGVTALTAGQRTGDNRVRWIEDATAMVPGGGGRATAMQQQASEQFTRAALARAGIQADRATPDVMNNAFADIGRQYDEFGRNAYINAPQARNLQQRVERIVRNYESMTPQTSRVQAVPGLAQDVVGAANGGVGLFGQRLVRYRSELRATQRALRNDPGASRALGEIVDALDSALVRSMPTAAARRQALDNLRTVNTRYRNILAIEDAASGAGEAATAGLISPALLRTAVKKANKREYVRGRHPMSDLARAGSSVLQPLRSSGTAERAFAQNVIGSPSAMLSGMAGGVVGGGDPVTMAASALAPWMVKAATARGIMSGPAQRYLRNQRFQNQVEPLDMRFLAPMAPYMLTRD